MGCPEAPSEAVLDISFGPCQGLKWGRPALESRPSWSHLVTRIAMPYRWTVPFGCSFRVFILAQRAGRVRCEGSFWTLLDSKPRAPPPCVGFVRRGGRRGRCGRGHRGSGRGRGRPRPPPPPRPPPRLRFFGVAVVIVVVVVAVLLIFFSGVVIGGRGRHHSCRRRCRLLGHGPDSVQRPLRAPPELTSSGRGHVVVPSANWNNATQTDRQI